MSESHCLLQRPGDHRSGVVVEMDKSICVRLCFRQSGARRTACLNSPRVRAILIEGELPAVSTPTEESDHESPAIASFRGRPRAGCRSPQVWVPHARITRDRPAVSRRARVARAVVIVWDRNLGRRATVADLHGNFVLDRPERGWQIWRRPALLLGGPPAQGEPFCSPGSTWYSRAGVESGTRSPTVRDSHPPNF